MVVLPVIVMMYSVQGIKLTKIIVFSSVAHSASVWHQCHHNNLYDPRTLSTVNQTLNS